MPETKMPIVKKYALKAICPFCLNKYKAIHRHKCKLAPENFTFQKEICHDEFFYHLYRTSVAFNQKTGHVDLIKLDQKAYRYSFIKLYHRLEKDPHLTIQTAIIGEHSDEEKAISEVLSTIREVKDEKHNLASTRRTKLEQLCPYCGQKYRRLFSHKCSVAPSFTFNCVIHPDEFFDLLYKASGIWDPRGFINLYRFDLERYRMNFIQAIKSLEQSDKPSVESLEQLLEIPDDKPVSEPREKSDLEVLDEKFHSNISLKLPKSSTESLKSEIQHEQICPFCYESFYSLHAHDCLHNTSKIEFTLALANDHAFFRRLYQEIGILNKYDRIDFNKFSRKRYHQLFIKYYKPPYIEEKVFKDYKQRILEQRQKEAKERERLLAVKTRKNKKLQEKRRKAERAEKENYIKHLKGIKQICPFCFQLTLGLSHHSCTKLPPEFTFSQLLDEVTFFKDLYKNSDGINRQGRIDQYRINRRKYLQMFIRIHGRLGETENPDIVLEYKETLDVPVSYDLSKYYGSLKQKVEKIGTIMQEEHLDVELQISPQICPYCFTLHECLYGHVCEHTPSGFAFDIQLYSANFFDIIYKKLGCLTHDGTLNFFIFDREEYTSLFSYHYSKFLSGMGDKSEEEERRSSKAISVVIHDKKEEEFPSRVSKEVVVEQKLLLLNNLKKKNQQIKHICPYCYNSMPDLSDHKCSKLPEAVPEGFQFESEACLDDFFLYLYYSGKVWQKKGFVDINKLNQGDYTNLFFKIYSKLVSHDKPSLKIAFEELYDDEDAQRQEKLLKSANITDEVDISKVPAVKLTKFRFKQICPHCFDMTENLSLHKCLSLPSEYDEAYRFMKIPYADEFFEALYSKSGALNRFKKLDQYRLNRKSYTKHFLQDYQALQNKIEQGVDTTDAVKNEGNSLAENSDIEDLGIEVDDEYSDMDLLELLSRDIDIESGEKQTKTKSAPKKMHESTDGMPLCFSCKNMVDCPKGLDSSQMESCMKCDAYEDMNRDSGASASAEEESGMPLCFSCSNMIDCPRGIDSNQMETIFSCKDFQDMNAPAESQEEKTPICFNCSNMINCPRGIDSSQMETIFECKQYRDINEPTLVSKTEGGNSSDSQKSIVLETTASEGDLLSSILSRRTEDREADEKHAKEEEEAKQNRIAEIMKEWEKSKGELKVFCKKCETEMQKVVTQKKVYYQCKNYPECLIRGDEWYVKKATEKRIITQKIKADLIKLYQFDETKNIVSISEIYSEGKLFL